MRSSARTQRRSVASPTRTWSRPTSDLAVCPRPAPLPCGPRSGRSSLTDRSCASRSGRPMARSSCPTPPTRPGLAAVPTPDFAAAAGGTVTAGLHPVADAESVGAVLPANDILRAYFPVKLDGEVVAVVGIWRDAAPILVRPGSAPSTGHARHAVRRRPGGRRPVPRVSRRPGTHPAADRRAPRGDAPGPADRHAESRRPGRGAGRRDRVGSPSRQDPRDRAPRHRQLPEPERDVRPSGRRPGTRRGRHAPCATCFPTRHSGGATDPTSSSSSSPPRRRSTWSRRSSSSERGSST